MSARGKRQALVTGLRGTLAPVLARALEAAGWQVQGWDRAQVPPGDIVAAERFLVDTRLDAIFHLATGDAAWAAMLGRCARSRGVPLVFTSTAMVFDAQPDGPYGPDAPRTAREPYGQGKIACEDVLRQACPSAWIARLGWQIDAQAPGNNMLRALDDWQAREGRVAASRRWRPACSFMADTVQALIEVAERPVGARGGVVHLDSNATEAWRFDQIAEALAQACGRTQWRVEAVDGHANDQRLVGGDLLLPPLSLRLPGLRGA